MAVPEIHLVCGPARWLHTAHAALSLTAASTLLAAGLGLASTSCALAGVGISHVLARRSLHRAAERAPRARLGWDGEARLLTPGGVEPAAWAPGGFDSAWLLILPLRSRTTGRLHRCLVTRARNSADDFRRARVLLRLGPRDMAEQGMLQP